MSLGLKNTRATYQRAIQECLEKEIQDDLVEAYVDDIVVKTKESHSLNDDMTHTFAALNQYQWKLNPKKCIFGVPFGILLGNIVSRDGIRTNLEKVQGVLNMKRLANIKDVQKHTGCMAALSRFLSRFGDKGLPFFKLLKAGAKFEWLEEADIAFTQLKQYLASPLVLTDPKSGEVLQLYIVATDRVISTVLVVEREKPGHAYGVQCPIYFIHEVLNESKTRYT
jgi:hypothetical protein